MANILDLAKGKPIESNYGIKRQRLIRQSRVRSVFTPRTPIKDGSLFSGRESEVQKLLEYITTPGLHALLYGDRGVGKSSLANIVTDLILKGFYPQCYRKSCSSDDTFETVFEEPLHEAGYIKGSTTTEKSGSSGIDGTASIGIATLKGGSHREEKLTIMEERKSANPSDLAKLLKKTDALMVVDELDRLQPAELGKIAELIKILSDLDSPFKLFLVGIAHNSSDLIDGHKSVQRCLMHTHLKPMSNRELRRIIDDGEKLTSPPITFTEIAKLQIIKLSEGYPHFTHLLALKAAEEAIGEEKTKVVIEDVVRAINSAQEDAEESLRDHYDKAINSDNTGLTQKILIAIAKSIGGDYSIHELSRMIKSIFNEVPQDSKIRYRVTRISSPTPDTILRNKGKGKFVINDPRMMCYIRIMNPIYFEEYMKS